MWRVEDGAGVGTRIETLSRKRRLERGCDAMTKRGEIEIAVGDVNDVEARIYARFVAAEGEATNPAEPITIRGTVRGPNCELARTLPAVFMFRGVSAESQSTAEALVTDPCRWSPELPHLYQCDVVAEQGDRIVAEYHGEIGFRRK
jgi:hypothetical protein